MSQQKITIFPPDQTGNLLMSLEDEEALREICHDPRNQEAIQSYNEYLIHDIASQRTPFQTNQGPPVTGRVVHREIPINSYSIEKRKKGDQPDLDEMEFIGQAVEVPFEKNIGFKKNSNYLSEASRFRKVTNQESKTPLKKWTKPPSERDLKIKSLKKKQDINKKYTKVDPLVREKVIKEKTANVNHVKNCRCKEYCEPKKYVIEQINARLVRPKSTERAKTPQKKESNAYLLHMADMIDEIMRIKVPEEPSSERKQVPSLATTAPSIAAHVSVKIKEVVQSHPKTKALPKKPTEEIISMVVKQDRVGRVVDKKKRIVKVVERNYEIDKNSFEVSELVNHIPSRVYSLHVPIEKTLAEVEDESVYKFDTDLFHPSNKIIIDERMVEYEKRSIHQLRFDGIEFPILKKKIHSTASK